MPDIGDPNGFKASKKEMQSDEQKTGEVLTAEEQMKHNLWGEMETSVQHLAELKGDVGGIETGIKKTVVALNLLGVVTDESCAGHPEEPLSRGFARVWIDEESAQKARQLIDEFYKQATKKSELIKLAIKSVEAHPGVRVIESRGAGKIPFLTAALMAVSFEKWINQITRMNQSYTNEMREFTQFIVGKFYSGSSEPGNVDNSQV